ncbi:MAG TPA: type II toxin-antitoxin system PemK/MazF family toxin, partial [Pseudonocardiaceae bacterium]|nr:type II toxin-antitoxin system PemK/MazF family toxin [Pseudonocardiaceae bacterium]
MSPPPQLAPWQVWWVDFGSPIGPEQGGIRPAIVVGSPAHCRFPIAMALVVPLTSRDRQLDHHVRIASPESRALPPRLDTHRRPHRRIHPAPHPGDTTGQCISRGSKGTVLLAPQHGRVLLTSGIERGRRLGPVTAGRLAGRAPATR